jgi:hypothetical protein
MLRIYADFNSTDEHDRVCLNTVGSLADLHAQETEVVNGARILLYMTNEFEVEAILVFDKIWMAAPDWKTLRYLPADK